MSVIKDFDNDFGFTIIPTDTFVDNKRSDAIEKLKELRAMLEPFLNNLASGKDDAVIKWPNRKQKIAEFQKKLDNFVDKSVNELLK